MYYVAMVTSIVIHLCLVWPSITWMWSKGSWLSFKLSFNERRQIQWLAFICMINNRIVIGVVKFNRKFSRNKTLSIWTNYAWIIVKVHNNAITMHDGFITCGKYYWSQYGATAESGNRLSDSVIKLVWKSLYLRPERL